jgi:hypothetical protein
MSIGRGQSPNRLVSLSVNALFLLAGSDLREIHGRLNNRWHIKVVLPGFDDSYLCIRRRFGDSTGD